MIQKGRNLFPFRFLPFLYAPNRIWKFAAKAAYGPFLIYFLALCIKPLRLNLPFPSAGLSLLIQEFYSLILIVQDMRCPGTLCHQVKFINLSSFIHF